MLPNHCGKALTSYQADARAHLLHRDQEREHIQRQPQLSGAEGSASLRICANAGRIVVGSASDQPEAPGYAASGESGAAVADDREVRAGVLYSTCGTL